MKITGLCWLLACVLGAVSLAGASRQQGPALPRVPDVVYIPTPREVVTAMLRMAQVGKGDVVYDLGSGDGRIVIAAVKEFGAARGVGVELDEARIQEARANAQRAGVKDRVEFRRQDVLETDFSDATVVTLYLSPMLNERLRPRMLAALRPGTRILSHVFDMGDWSPAEAKTVSGRMVYLWTIPPRP